MHYFGVGSIFSRAPRAIFRFSAPRDRFEFRCAAAAAAVGEFTHVRFVRLLHAARMRCSFGYFSS